MISLSKKDIKAILQIEDPDMDEYIEAMLPLAIDMVEGYCNDVFSTRDLNGKLIKVDDGYVLSEGGIVIPIAKLIQFYTNQSGVTQESVSRVMYSYTSDIPKSITTPLNSYRRVNFV